MKSVETMTPDELCAEAVKIRKQIVLSAEKLAQVCEVLYSFVRKHPTDLSPVYVNISNATKRFAGSVAQGAKRTEALQRTLDVRRAYLRMAKEKEAKKAELERMQEERELRMLLAASKKDPYGLFGSSNEDAAIEQIMSGGDSASDLNDLYGEE